MARCRANDPPTSKIDQIERVYIRGVYRDCYLYLKRDFILYTRSIICETALARKQLISGSLAIHNFKCTDKILPEILKVNLLVEMSRESSS